MTTRRVVITADDLGLDPAVNAAISRLATAGRLHRASLLIDAAHAGAALAAELPIAVGLHIDLPGALLREGTSAQLLAEIDRQWQQMVAGGRTPAHLDLHTTALYGLGRDPVRPGGVLPEALAVAAEHSVGLRLPRRLPEFFTVDTRGHQELLALADRAGVPLPQTILSDFRPAPQVTSYQDLRTHYRDLIRSLPEGCSEIFLHPALPAAEDKRRWEYRLLASGDLHHDLAAAGISAVGPEG